MGLIDNLKSAGEQATASARESLRESQLIQDLTHAYVELGRAAYALLEQGALTDQRLAPGAQSVRALERELAALAPAGLGPTPNP